MATSLRRPGVCCARVCPHSGDPWGRPCLQRDENRREQERVKRKVPREKEQETGQVRIEEGEGDSSEGGPRPPVPSREELAGAPPSFQKGKQWTSPSPRASPTGKPCPQVWGVWLSILLKRARGWRAGSCRLHLAFHGRNPVHRLKFTLCSGRSLIYDPAGTNPHVQHRL